MVELGLTPVQSLQAGTVNAADLMGWSDKIGAIETGNYRGHRCCERRSADRHQATAACGIRDERRSGLQRNFLVGESL